MNNAYEDHAGMLDELHREQESANLVATWNGNPFNILPGGAKFKREMDRGGFDLDSDLQLTCTTAQFGGNIPNAAELITYQGLNYLIKSVSTPGGAYQIRINCILQNAEP